MNARDKDKIVILINEAMVQADTDKEILTGLDGDCEEINVPCLTIPQVKMLLENLKLKLLKDDDPNEDPDKPRICPVCGSKKVQPMISPGSWGYYPASAHIECLDCGTRSKEYDGKDDCDQKGAIKKATRAWNKGRVEC